MMQSYTIFVNDTVLIIAEFLPAGLSRHKQLDIKSFDFKEFYKKVKKETAQTYVLISNDPKKYFREMRRKFMVIKAAGGIVFNEANEILFIYRKQKWDLPKGKLDLQERTRDAAVREVEEECGIKVDECGDKLCKTWHVYELKGLIIFKQTSWYLMKAKKQKLVPQAEEDITDARWLKDSDLALVSRNTYPLIKDIIALLAQQNAQQ